MRMPFADDARHEYIEQDFPGFIFHEYFEMHSLPTV